MNILAAVREYQLTIAADAFSTEATGRDDTRKFGMVMKYINQNYMEEIPLEKIAYIAGYSKYHFSRLFKKYNNVSYIQYINSKRIKAAERLLIDPNLSVTEVAMRAGFASLPSKASRIPLRKVIYSSALPL